MLDEYWMKDDKSDESKSDFPGGNHTATPTTLLELLSVAKYTSPASKPARIMALQIRAFRDSFPPTIELLASSKSVRNLQARRNSASNLPPMYALTHTSTASSSSCSADYDMDMAANLNKDIKT